MPVAYWTPLQWSLSRMRDMLFRPFDFVKWLAMGFTAWLAQLGEGGINLNLPDFDHGAGGKQTEAVLRGLIDFYHQHQFAVLSLAAMLVVFCVVFVLALTWINSRGRFMFLDNVVHNRAEVVRPWTAWRAQGNSLFGWQLLFGLVVLVSVIAMVVTVVLAVVPLARSGPASGPALPFVLLMLGVALVPFFLLLIYVALFLVDFVIPIMFGNRCGVLAAWRTFLQLFSRYPGAFLLYGLFCFFLWFVVVAGLLLLFCLTCCCAAILAIIPYLGSVFLLPLFVVYRLFSLAFLRQFGPEFDLLPSESPPPCPPPPAPVASA